jgi:hypothetical protein
MTPRLHPFIVVVALALSHWQASAVMAQVGELHFTHGAAEGGQVRTNRSAVAIGESNVHTQLPSSALTVQLQPGDSDLFVLEFDAECAISGSTGDHLSVQARLNGAVGPEDVRGVSFLQPQDSPTDLQVCSVSGANGDHAHTISKSWVIRLSNDTSSPATHTFSIWVRTVDVGGGQNVLTLLDNRIVRFTRYN